MDWKNFGLGCAAAAVGYIGGRAIWSGVDRAASGIRNRGKSTRSGGSRKRSSRKPAAKKAA